MITKLSWRRDDSRPLEDGGRASRASAQPLMASDEGSVTALHLDPGGELSPETSNAGQLLIVTAGRGQALVGEEWEDVVTGDAIRWPATVPHALRTEAGISVLVFTYPERSTSWRVSRVLADGARWVAGVFSDTGRARAFRERLKGSLPEEQAPVLE